MTDLLNLRCQASWRRHKNSFFSGSYAFRAVREQPLGGSFSVNLYYAINVNQLSNYFTVAFYTFSPATGRAVGLKLWEKDAWLSAAHSKRLDTNRTVRCLLPSGA